MGQGISSKYQTLAGTHQHNAFGDPPVQSSSMVEPMVEVGSIIQCSSHDGAYRRIRRVVRGQTKEHDWLIYTHY